MEMRGLTMFISDIRKAANKEEEQKRIESELAKIRKKFKSDSKMIGYDRKKYVCKLLYAYMLGYDIDFGHMEAVNLLSSNMYWEKHVGYLACTLLLNESHELLTLITNCIKRDLESTREEVQCLALTCIANLGNKDFAESLAQDVQRILVSADTKILVRKKAALCLLRLFRKYPEVLPPDTWSERVINLLGGRDLGVITSIMSLILGLASRSPADYEAAVPRVIRMLSKIVLSKEYTNDYVYYTVPSPWLQVKLIRLLEYYPPPSDPALMQQVNDVLKRILTTTEIVKSVNRNNASHAVLFEAINLVIHYDDNKELLAQSAQLLGRYIAPTVREANLRYLALDTMARLALTSEGETAMEMRKHQEIILQSLKEADISIRRRALDLLYSLCDRNNAMEIVGELLNYLKVAEFAIREELVLKIAILAEKFAPNLTWYVDTVLNVIASAGDYVADDIWYRVVQIVTNNEDLQRYAAENVFKAVKSPAAHEACVKVAGYILGEFGHLIAESPEMSPAEQFNILHSKFTVAPLATKQLLLNTYIKFYNMFEDAYVRQRIHSVFETYRNFVDAEMQQRANEYFTMARSASEDLMSTVLETMPLFADRESSVMRKIRDRGKEGADRDIFSSKAGAEDASASSSGSSSSAAGGDSMMSSPARGGMPNVNAAQEPNLLDMMPSTPQQQQQQPAHPLAAHSSQGLDSLLGGGVSASLSSPAQASYASSSSSVSPPGLDDLLGASPAASIASAAASMGSAMAQNRAAAGVSIDDIFSSSGSSASAAAVDNSEIEAARNDARTTKFQTLVLADNGVVYEDSRLQIGVKSEYKGNAARMILFFGNKSATPVTQITSAVSSIAQVQIQHSQVAPMIAPRQQVQQLVSVKCLQPFSDDITVTVSFEVNHQAYRLDNLRLPIVCSKFTAPLQIEGAEAFFGQWKTIPDSSQSQSVFKTARPIDIEYLTKVFSQGFKLSVLQGIDPNPANMVMAGTHHSESGQVTVLVRAETNAKMQALRLTIKSTNAAVVEAFRALIVAVVGEPAPQQ